MKQYLELLKDIYENGVDRPDRTGTGTRSIFGYQMRFDLSDGFPLLTTKRVSFKSVAHELLWFLSGSTNVKDLHKHNVHIWDAWADDNGDIGELYGKQWTAWDSLDGPINQVQECVDLIREDSSSRRILISTWNVADLPSMALAPCHGYLQFYVAQGKLSAGLYQRSGDIFLGVPFNIASYALFIHMMAHVCGLKVGEFVHSFGDVHIYQNHFQQVEKQLGREIRPLPTLEIIGDVHDIFQFSIDNFRIRGYKPHPRIKAQVSV